MECKGNPVDFVEDVIRVEIDTFWNVKLITDNTVLASDTGRNRYILECKVLRHYMPYRRNKVEIDTFWNVKRCIVVSNVELNWVEIDTFWNVKFTIIQFLDIPSRVEIDTFWNVKCFDCSKWYSKQFVEIDTFWNVKLRQANDK